MAWLRHLSVIAALRLGWCLGFAAGAGAVLQFFAVAGRLGGPRGGYRARDDPPPGARPPRDTGLPRRPGGAGGPLPR